jgi:hypothetical protein
MDADKRPTLEAFLAAPLETVKKVAPATMVFAAGGTRRAAVLAGVSLTNDDYVSWTRRRLVACFDLIFRHGVQHILAPVIIQSNFSEAGHYRRRLLAWVEWGLASAEALADYGRLGWRVRLLGAGSIPELAGTAERLQQMTTTENAPTVWFTVATHADAPWEELLTAAQHAGARSRREAILALYGEAIPPATLLLSFGKPEIFPDLIPPLLIGKMQCYWRQSFGYELDERQFRAILYDYAYLRSTWQEDKTGRAEQVWQYRAAWERPPTIGLGVRLGPFWYPAPIHAPADGTSERDTNQAL